MSEESNGLSHLKHRLVRNSHKIDANYEELSEICDKTNKQYWNRVNSIPWRAICLALFLLIVGTALLVIALMISIGFIETFESIDQILVLLFLGLIVFVPGFYHMRIAFYAYYRYDGYTFDNIPDFE